MWAIFNLFTNHIQCNSPKEEYRKRFYEIDSNWSMVLCWCCAGIKNGQKSGKTEFDSKRILHRTNGNFSMRQLFQQNHFSILYEIVLYKPFSYINIPISDTIYLGPLLAFRLYMLMRQTHAPHILRSPNSNGAYSVQHQTYTHTTENHTQFKAIS